MSETCTLCGKEILDLPHGRVGRQVVGWVLPRKSGVFLRYETGALAHAVCIETGVKPEPLRLFDHEQQPL